MRLVMASARSSPARSISKAKDSDEEGRLRLGLLLEPGDFSRDGAREAGAIVDSTMRFSRSVGSCGAGGLPVRVA